MKNKIKIDLDNFAPYIVSTLSRQFATLLETSLKKKGLSISYWRVLLCLSTHETRSLNQIVEYTLIAQSTLSRSLVRMEKKGLITRERKPEDNRLFNIKITDYGATILNETFNAIQKSCAKQLSGLSEEETKTWIETMKKIISHMSD